MAMSRIGQRAVATAMRTGAGGAAARSAARSWALHAPAAAPALARGFSILKKPKKQDDNLDLSHLLTQSTWSNKELTGIEQKHRPAADFCDRAALFSIRVLRHSFDLVSLYKVKYAAGYMREPDWLRRVIFLETVAGVPGMVAGMVRHLHSLRLMRRDHGWIHSLLSEAENERMHLLIALQLREPGPVFRAAVIGGQFVFISFYTLAYLISPRYCHRFVGYLEEEAVHTYTALLKEIDDGKLPMFAGMRAPAMARVYYNLPHDATMREVFACIRADEGAHRDTNHHFADLRPDEPNTMVEHLRKGHFQNQGAFSGVASEANKGSQEEVLLSGLRQRDPHSTGKLPEGVVREVLQEQSVLPELEARVAEMLKAAGVYSEGMVRYVPFVQQLVR